jgi:mRNA-degrading endonuclease RelE of RelBE toxin-antitoxin system
MVRVKLSPEGVTSFRRLPASVKTGFDDILTAWESTPRLRLPGGYSTHQLGGARNLWTLKVGPYRGVFRWDGQEARFIRFGHRDKVYARLPK